MNKTKKREFLKTTQTEKRKLLITARKSKGLTQKQVAEIAGISRTAYTNIELGTAMPSVKTAISIAKALDFDWTSFFVKEKEQDAL